MQAGAGVDPITAQPLGVINPAAGRMSMGSAADFAKAVKAAVEPKDCSARVVPAP